MQSKAKPSFFFVFLQSSDNTTRLGTAVLNIWDVFDDKNWYWVGVGALLAFAVLFNCLFTLALTYLDGKFFCYCIQSPFTVTTSEKY